ncbi:MAG: alpha-ketoglutarate-dependent dioxygenase AlkB [Myxococcota bacterium]|nr:alpha-ketoglutarate-dependent dioxygenase AlkB [Myxococcota bacterium]
MLRIRADARAQRDSEGQHYDARFVTPPDRAEFLRWVGEIHPLWEDRFSLHHPPPAGQSQRRLLRPVYWLGNWQFACLGYYHPPKGMKNRCVAAEPFPPVMARWVAEIERLTRAMFRGPELPRDWHLNTCLVNLYGNRREGERWVDSARVGEHKDFEPGPVASVSLGERALFQFVASSRPGQRDAVVSQQWLDDGSLQIFGGQRFKQHLFHRVQRVDHRGGQRFSLQHVSDFETRRVNLTFRYVPDPDVIPYARLPAEDREDVRGYMATLAKHSEFFARQLAQER